MVISSQYKSRFQIFYRKTWNGNGKFRQRVQLNTDSFVKYFTNLSAKNFSLIKLLFILFLYLYPYCTCTFRAKEVDFRYEQFNVLCIALHLGKGIKIQWINKHDACSKLLHQFCSHLPQSSSYIYLKFLYLYF